MDDDTNTTKIVLFKIVKAKQLAIIYEDDYILKYNNIYYDLDIKDMLRNDELEIFTLKKILSADNINEFLKKIRGRVNKTKITIQKDVIICYEPFFQRIPYFIIHMSKMLKVMIDCAYILLPEFRKELRRLLFSFTNEYGTTYWNTNLISQYNNIDKYILLVKKYLNIDIILPSHSS